VLLRATKQEGILERARLNVDWHRTSIGLASRCGLRSTCPITCRRSMTVPEYARAMVRLGKGAPVPSPGRRVAISLLSNAGSTVIVALLAVVAVRLMTRHLGPTDYGLFVTALTFVTLATFLTDLGITDITGREISKNSNSAPQILGRNVGLRLALSVALVPVLIIIGSLVYRGSQPQLRWAIVIISLATPFQSVRSVITGLFIATIRNHITAVLQVLNQSVFLASLIIALLAHTGVLGCATAYLFTALVTCSITLVITRVQVPFRLHIDITEWRMVLVQSMSIGLIQIVNMVYLKADMILLSLMTTPRQVGLYGLAYVVIGYLNTGPNLLMTTLIPLIAQAREEELGSLVRRATSLLATSGALVSCGTILFAPAVVQLLGGPKFADAVTPVRILGVSCLFTYINSGLGYTAFARNKHQRMLAVSIAGLMLNVAANLVVIPRFGINGAAWATCGSELVTLMGVYIIFRKDVGVRTPILIPLIRPVLVAVTIGVIVQEVWFSSGTQHVSSLLYIPVIVLAYFSSLAIVNGLPEDIVRIIRRIAWR
jgi:O-antigen/teichoic acid export membrane protein